MMGEVTGKWRLGRIALHIFVWYASSLVTLFMNKWFLLKEGLNGSPQTLALAQTIFSAATGVARFASDSVVARGDGAELRRNSNAAAKVLSSNSADSTSEKFAVGRRTFQFQMLILGTMRFSTVVLGLVALEHLAVSFTETIKSSAPFVTAIFAWFLLEERTPERILVTLLPIVLGLALSSFSEVSFNIVGFTAAMACNFIDCVQNVYSKRLLQNHTPVQLQFYASVAALCVQVPLTAAIQLYYCLPIVSFSEVSSAPHPTPLKPVQPNVMPRLGGRSFWFLAVNGVFFYVQSVSAYGLMELVSPVTHSVCNCVKRALLIWLSVLFWKNEVGPLNAVGTAVLFGGVLMYNHRVRQQRSENLASHGGGSGSLRKSGSYNSLPLLLRTGERSVNSRDEVEAIDFVEQGNEFNDWEHRKSEAGRETVQRCNS